MRFLTEDEIENILDFIKPNKSIPIATAKSIIHITKEKFRNQLKKQKLYPEIIPELKKQLENKYRESLIEPGESVGIIAAQSIGEKQTQSTLNSVDWKDVILYTKDSKHIIEPIGQMIDNLLLKHPEMIDKIEENRTEYLSLEDGYYIPSCDENGITSWCKIEAITRHLPVGKLVKVTTESGRVVTATQSKSFLVWNGEKFIDKEGANIKIGDILPTTQKLNRFSDKLQEYITYDSIKVDLDREIGFLIGLYINIDNEKNLVKYEERINKLKLKYSFNLNNFLENITLSGTSIPLFSYNCSDEYIKGLLTGFFKSCIYNTKDGSIECISYYENIISGILFLLTYFRVFGNFINIEDEFNLIYKLKIKSDNTYNLEYNILEEFWEDINDKMGLYNYEVSNLGKIRNKNTMYILKAKPKKDGYIILYLSLGNKIKKSISVHRICLTTFIFNDDEEKIVIDHINRNKTDNRISNLRWSSYSDNNKNKEVLSIKGKKIEQYSLDGVLIKVWNKTTDACKELNIKNQSISAVLKNKQKTAAGYIWKYSIENIEGEIWKKIPSIEKEYYASNYGRIKKNNDDSTITYGNKKKNGYHAINIKDKDYFVHRLICLTFLKNLENKPFVNHIDGNKSNNKIINLEWINHKDNVIHSYKLRNGQVLNNILSRKVLQIKDNLIINKFDSLSIAVKETGIKGLKNCCYGKRKTAGGFIWKFEEINKEIEIENNTKKYIFYDKIISIEFVKGSTDYVYDLTVEKTRNFQLFNGLNMRDTFHKIGFSDKAVTTGVNLVAQVITKL